MLGIDLLSNKKNTKAELNVSSDIGGYSSDDGSVKSNQSKTKKEDFDFFSKIKESDKNDNIQEKNVDVEPKSAPIKDDPILSAAKNEENGDSDRFIQ